jgi:hypothetical protein
MFVIREERLVGTEELADSHGVMNRSVEVRVIGYINGTDEGSPRDGMERPFQRALMPRVHRKKLDKSFA